MKFYRLTHPDYETDMKQLAANPVRMRNEYYVPGISCPYCAEVTGGGWASSDRVRVAVPKQTALLRYLTNTSLGLAEWTSISERVRAEFRVPSWMPITPGAQLGLPSGELTATRVPDLLHPFPGQIIARQRVVSVIEKAGLSGVHPIKVESVWSNRVEGAQEELPSLWELVVTGQGWRMGSNLDAITACKHCGRTEFPNPGQLTIDENRWDGSDFLHIDKNPNIVIVTERVCQVFGEQKLSNWLCVPVG